MLNPPAVHSPPRTPRAACTVDARRGPPGPKDSGAYTGLNASAAVAGALPWERRPPKTVSTASGSVPATAHLSRYPLSHTLLHVPVP